MFALISVHIDDPYITCVQYHHRTLIDGKVKNQTPSIDKKNWLLCHVLFRSD